MTLTGIIWISLVKGSTKVSDMTLIASEDQSYYKTLSVLFATGVGTLNASMTVQLKFMFKRMKMDVLDTASDSSLVCALIYSLISLFYYLLGHESVNKHNA